MATPASRRDPRTIRYGELKDFTSEKGTIRAVTRAEAAEVLKTHIRGPKFTPSLRNEPCNPVPGVDYLGTRAVVRQMNRGGAQ
ncbi:hypothetical protein [Methylobacterium nodulans]|uniref:Uncharacterized protein n=1 Tax=Methylobacterium nodulans (strain LMG 21967 / CNCM I-2342 / ORS 2060) TaxID=460265 RepID=B8ICR0_METNO|nr:hypothetical protein [Methylobacterium nodulans]ACL57471.1 hypothetical protein Mnod_2501 [Methylobacterium nodulans ORS 2060]